MIRLLPAQSAQSASAASASFGFVKAGWGSDLVPSKPSKPSQLRSFAGRDALVHSAAGGVGDMLCQAWPGPLGAPGLGAFSCAKFESECLRLAALQVLRICGLRVIGVVGQPSKVKSCKASGRADTSEVAAWRRQADVVIDKSSDDWALRLLELPDLPLGRKLRSKQPSNMHLTATVPCSTPMASQLLKTPGSEAYAR